MSTHIFFPSPLARSQVRVCHRANFNRRKATPDLELEGEELWQARLATNPRLFNASKFRYAGLAVEEGEVSGGAPLSLVLPNKEAPIPAVTLRTGLSSYRDHTLTNTGPLREEYVRAGVRLHGDKGACLGNIIGHSALLLTSDNFVVIQLRSMAVGEGAGVWHFPGGHPEPSEIGLEEEKEEKRGAADEVGDIPTKIRDEIFDSLGRELREELNLLEESLGEVRLLGITRDKEALLKPEFHFILRTSLTSAEVAARYTADDFDDWESDEIAFWRVGELELGERQTMPLHRVKGEGGAAEVEEVSVEQLAECSRSFLSCLSTILAANPRLFDELV